MSSLTETSAGTRNGALEGRGGGGQGRACRFQEVAMSPVIIFTISMTSLK